MVQLSRLLLFASTLIACNATSENDNKVDVFNSSIVESNQALAREIKRVYFELDNKLKDSISHARAAVWFPKLIYIDGIISADVRFLDSLLYNVQEDNILPSNSSKRIYTMIRNSEQKLLSVDSMMTLAFGYKMIFSSAQLDSLKREFPDDNSFFTKNSNSIKVAAINSIKNKYYNCQLRLNNFCNSKVAFYCY